MVEDRGVCAGATERRAQGAQTIRREKLSAAAADTARFFGVSAVACILAAALLFAVATTSTQPWKPGVGFGDIVFSAAWASTAIAIFAGAMAHFFASLGDRQNARAVEKE